MISGTLSKQAWMVAPETVKVMAALHDDGGEARFVGGCVRDALANRSVIDIDIATPLTPEEVVARLDRHDIRHAPTGLKHGTVTAIVDGKPFEITTLRRDVHTYGRHADVKFTDNWEADAARRDFTINALYATMEGEICDFFGGMEDLRNGRVAFVGDAGQRIHEDVLRILRFFRFYAHFGRGAPDAAALSACAENAAKIRSLSAERIRQETLKLLESDRAAAVWRLMQEQRVATHFLPEATNADALERLIALEAAYHSPPFPLRRLAALLEVDAAGARQVAQALRLSNAQGDMLEILAVPQAGVYIAMDDAAVRRQVYHHGNDMVRSLLLLAAARTGPGDRLRGLYDCATSFRPPQFPLRGQDAMMLGLAGEAVGQALRAVEEWWMEEDFQPGRTSCLARLKSLDITMKR